MTPTASSFTGRSAQRPLFGLPLGLALAGLGVALVWPGSALAPPAGRAIVSLSHEIAARAAVGAASNGGFADSTGVASENRAPARAAVRAPASGAIDAAAGAALTSKAVQASPGEDPGAEDFDSRWHDGKAEIDGYRLTIERYGHPRAGRGVLVYVTEPFSGSRHVKVDDPSKDPGDTIDVLKLNVARRFQTGVYDYSTMVSLFARSDNFAPVKISFAGAEWCGQVYEELNFDGDRLGSRLFSYFEGESSDATLAVPREGIEEDDLFILLRGLRGEFLAPGRNRTAPFLTSPFYRRLAHQSISWTTATVERLEGPETVRVPAGVFSTTVFVVKPADGREGRFNVERAAPHRIVRWAWTPPATASEGAAHFLGGTDRGELTGSSRLAYWKLHDPGDEKYLEGLGLEPVVK